MRTLLGGLLAALTFGVGVSAEDKKDDKIDAKKLIGKWELKDLKGRTGGVIEYTKEGEVTYTHVLKGEKGSSYTLNYKLDGNKLVVILYTNPREKTVTRTVAKLTDDELVLKDLKGKEQAFTRIKDK
jgi:uncharacterized protein (TIGR03066 family)